MNCLSFTLMKTWRVRPWFTFANASSNPSLPKKFTSRSRSLTRSATCARPVSSPAGGAGCPLCGMACAQRAMAAHNARDATAVLLHCFVIRHSSLLKSQHRLGRDHLRAFGNCGLSCILLARRREDIEYLGVGQGPGLVLHAAVDHDAVAAAQLAAFAARVKPDLARDHVDDLMMRMAVERAGPSAFKTVPYKHEMRVVSQHLAQHAGFRRAYQLRIARHE